MSKTLALFLKTIKIFFRLKKEEIIEGFETENFNVVMLTILIFTISLWAINVLFFHFAINAPWGFSISFGLLSFIGEVFLIALIIPIKVFCKWIASNWNKARALAKEQIPKN